MSDYYFELLNWDESPYWQGEDGSKMTKASISKSYFGQLQGVGQLEYIMSYQADGSASFVGMERVNGKLEGKQGEFVLQHQGHFVQGKVHSSFVLVKGSATRELTGMEVQGHFIAGHGAKVQFEFDYQLPR